jgi:hypothetical protein
MNPGKTARVATLVVVLVLLESAAIGARPTSVNAAAPCPQNTSSDIYADPVTSRPDGITPTGVRSPAYCRFRTLTGAINSAKSRGLSAPRIIAAGAGSGVGKMLAAILTAALPDSPAAALAAVEALLVHRRPDDTPQEERNYRLALELRTELDALAQALGPGRLQRSLLVCALLGAHAPADAEQARELLTAQRIDALRASVLQSGS